MARFEINEGPPGQGKSIYQAALVERLLLRNSAWFGQLEETYPARREEWVKAEKWHKSLKDEQKYIAWLRDHPEPKKPRRRQIMSNQRFSASFEEYAKGYLQYWTELEQLTMCRDCDIIWDEIATELDSRNWVNLSIEMKRFLSQYRKRGIDIYGNTQDFSMVDQRARLMISNVRTLSKILGSRDISTTKPPPKTIWGICMIRDVVNFKETDPEKKKYEIFPSFILISRDLVSIYDTRQDIKLGAPPPLRHEIRFCEHHKEVGGDGNCDFCKTFHS